MNRQAAPKASIGRYGKVLIWAALSVILLTAAQYGSLHLLSGRPSSWLFEASLDLAPPLLFAGDLAQVSYTEGSQLPLRDQLQAVAIGVMVNVILYSVIAMLVAWLFFPPAMGRRRLSEEKLMR